MSAPLRTVSIDNSDYWSNFAVINASKLQDKSLGFVINVCQCCYLTGVVKNMFHKFNYRDNVEVYADMIDQAFGIQFPYNNSTSYHICLVCVEKLRNAVTFKQQVLETQDKIKDQQEQSEQLLLKPLIIKEEPHTEPEDINKNEDISNNYNNNNSKRYNIDNNKYNNDDDKFHKDNKKYDNENNKDDEKINNDCNINDEDNNKFNDDDEEDYTDDDNDSDWLPEESLPLKEIKQIIKNEINATESEIVKLNKKKNAIKNNVIKKNVKVEKKYSNDNIDTKTENKIIKYKKKKITKRGNNQFSGTIQTERLLDMKHNTILLMRNSNACLYRYKFNKFECYRCKTFFMDFEELREHSKKHTWEEIDKDINAYYIILYRKVDISDLKCSICDIDLLDFVELRQHLTENHKIKFRGKEDLLVPYRIKDTDFRCVICKDMFQNYCKLNVHTNKHFQSFICELCGSGFISQKNLLSHKEKTHEKKKHKCKECKIEFKNEYFKRLHNTKVHHLEGVRVCLYCPERFHQHTKKMFHMVRVHGHKMKFHKCSNCEKSFMTNSLLKTHVRLTHMKVKEFACPYCDASFSLKQHMNVHVERHCSKNSES